MTYLDEVAADIEREVPATVMPDEDTRALFRLYALLALAKGVTVTAADVHDAWSAWMQERDPTHKAIRPFDELDSETQGYDEPFVRAIQVVARRVSLTRPVG